MKGDAAFVIYVAVDLPAPHVETVLHRRNAQTGIIEPYVPKLGQDKELVQLSLEFPSAPVKERHIEEAFRQFKFKVLEKMRAAKLVVE